MVDTYSDRGKKGADLETRDPIANNWHVADWKNVEPYTCLKINSEGCDMLTAKIYKYWHEYNTQEDISLQNGTYLISLYTRVCDDKLTECRTEQYNKESAWFFDILETAHASIGLMASFCILPLILNIL